MAANTYADISPYVNTIYNAALTIARDQTFVDKLGTSFNDRMGLAPRTVTQYTQASINQVGEMDDLVSQQFTRTTLSTLTPYEYAGQFFLTDSRVETDPESVRTDAALELGMALATSIEVALVGDFANFTGGTVGTAGSTFTWSNFLAGITALRNRNAPRPYVAVLHPNQYHDLAQAVTPAAAAVTNAPNFQDEVMRQFYVQSAAGVDIFTSSNISISGSDATGAIFSKAALAIDWRRAPRLEPERDASRRGWELNMTAVYAHGVWRPTYGVQLISDATTPV